MTAVAEESGAGPGGAGLASVMIGLSMVAFGLVPLFVRYLDAAGFAPVAVAMYRFALPALVFAPMLRLSPRDLRATVWGLCSGAVVAVGWTGYFHALTVMPVPVAGILYMTYPLFVLIVGWAVFRDRPHPRAWLSGAVILVAAASVTPLAGGGPGIGGGFGVAAVLLALAAPAGFGLGVNVLAHRLVTLPPMSRVAAFSAGSTLGIMPAALGLPAAEVLPGDAGEALLVLGLTLVTALVPQITYNIYLPKIGAAKAGMLGAIELPTMLAVGWLALGEEIGPREAVAGALVLAAILMTPARPSGIVRAGHTRP